MYLMWFVMSFCTYKYAASLSFRKLQWRKRKIWKVYVKNVLLHLNKNKRYSTTIDKAN